MDTKPIIELTPPEPVSMIEPEQAAQLVKLDQTAVPSLNAQIDEFIQTIIKLDTQHTDFKNKIESIHNLGHSSITKSASFSHRLLSRSISNMDNESSTIGQSLIELRRTLDDLNPASNDQFFSRRKLLGLIPFGQKIEAYFDKYRSSEAHLNAILNSLENGKDELVKDNIGIERDKVMLWETMQQIEQYMYIGRQLDEKLTTCLYEIEIKDAEKARIIREEVLFYLRQKVTDLLTQQVISVQSYLSLDLIRKNNLELIKGVDRATMTTVSALRTAVIVAQALVNQKLVLKQVQAVNKTTEDLIVTTSQMLKKQTFEIQHQASNTVIDIDKLQLAFDNIYATIDMVTNFKVKSLDGMKQNIELMTTQLERANQYVDQVRRADIDQQLQSVEDNHSVKL